MNYFIFILAIFVCACNNISPSDNNGYVVFQGLPNKDVLLYKVTKDKNDKKIYYPLIKISTNTKLALPKGVYFLANDCSSYEFESDGITESKIVLSKLKVVLSKKNVGNVNFNPNENFFNSYCIDPLDGKEHWFSNRLSYDILPGKNYISISGRHAEFNYHTDSFSEKKFELWPLSLTAPINTDLSKFFSLPLDLKDNEKSFVMTAPVNSTIWLPSGRYQIEVNGTKQIVAIKNQSSNTISLGVIRVSSPKNFPIEERLKAGGQPIFAYINEKVLFQLNTNYPVFPGKYKVSLEGTEIEKDVLVQQDSLTEVNTRGALVQSPHCPEKYEKCRIPSRITLHVNKMPFVLMSVPTDMPFLVFDQKYEYGIEGIKGIFKTLFTSNESVYVDKLGRVKIKWETRYTTGNTKTDFVRFESRSAYLSGKSIDILYFKPNEIYLPEGDYWLTYFVGDLNFVLPKTRADVSLIGGVTKEVVIPIYIQKSQEALNQDKSKESASSDTKTILSPIKN